MHDEGTQGDLCWRVRLVKLRVLLLNAAALHDLVDSVSS